MPRKKRPEGTRAPNGASSIYYSEYDGKWHGRVTVGVRDNGEPDRRHVKRKTETEVVRAVRQIENARDSGTLRKPGRVWTVGEWLTHWFDNIAVPNVRYKTQTYYQTAISKYLTPGLGAHRLDKLEPEHIERLYTRLRKEGAKPSTLQQVHRTLRAALNEAHKRQRLVRNPVVVVKSPPTVEVEIEPLTVKDAQSILQYSVDRRNGIRWALALALGFRQGEAIGLKWSDITLEWEHGCPEDAPCEMDAAECPTPVGSGVITVRRALQRQTWKHGCTKEKPCNRKRGAECPRRHSGGLVEVNPKSRAGRRVVSLPGPLVHGLAEHRIAQAAERDKAQNLWHESGWVFTQPNGKPLDPRSDHAEWKTLLNESGVREARLHDARHTAATMLMVLQVPNRAVMDVMGWSQASMAQRYMHVPNELRDDIANQVGGLLWPGGNSRSKPN